MPNRFLRIATSAVTSFTGGPGGPNGTPMLWVQAECPGSSLTVSLTDASGVATTGLVLNDREAVAGQWSSLQSYTGNGALRFGDGPVPRPILGSTTGIVPGSGGPVAAISVANLTLSGTQTIDGVVCGVGARVYAAAQTTATQSGLYVVAAGAWSLAPDWPLGGTIPLGTQIQVAPGGTANFQAFGATWYVDSASGVVGTGTIVAYPKLNKGLATLVSGSPSTVTISNLWIKGTIASGASSAAIVDATTAANGVKCVLVAGAGSGSATFTGPNTVSDVVSYIIANG